MFHVAQHSTLNNSTSSLPLTSPVLLSSSSPNPDQLSTHPLFHCEDSRRYGTSTEIHSSTGYEPKRIELNRFWSIHKIRYLTTRMILRKMDSNRCPAANHWFIQHTIRQKALRRRLTRTSKTSNILRKMLA